MSLIDTYRNNISRKRSEFSKLSSDKAKESDKKARQKQKIISATNSLKRLSSQSTIRLKTSEIEGQKKKLPRLIRR